MTQLHRYLAIQRTLPYAPGAYDCAGFVLQWADLLTGSRLVSQLCDYSTKFAGLRQYVPPHGSLCGAIKHYLVREGWREIAGPTRDGDIVLTNIDHPGIFSAGEIIARPEGCTGLLHLCITHTIGVLRCPA